MFFRSPTDIAKIESLEDQLQSSEELYEDLQKEHDKLVERTSGHERDLRTLKNEIKEHEEAARQAAKEKRKAEDELETVKSKKKREDEEIQHHVKIQKEEQELELRKKEVEINAAADKKVMDIKESCNKTVADLKDKQKDELNKLLKGQITDVKDTMSSILERLPNVNMTGHFGNQPSDDKDAK